jgi:lipopolysaccharide/colanic/teichoic acid biosynthesis glycosyltransferase
VKQMVAFDLEYIQKWTPVMDFWILIRTLISLVVSKNAY